MNICLIISYSYFRDLKKDFQSVEKKLRSACEGLVNKVSQDLF